MHFSYISFYFPIKYTGGFIMAMSNNISKKFEELSAMIGNTPLLEISFEFRGRERKIYVKAESYNLTGSIKDRIAYHIMKRSYESGTVKEGDMIAEATSGNTGISFAAIGAYLGNPVTIFMPDWMSKERKDLITSFGAEIKSVSNDDGGFKGCIEKADKMGENGAFLPHQFTNKLNIDAHYETTGKEIINQLAKLGKKPDGVVSGVGTGGTIMGLKNALQEAYPQCKAFPVDPASSPALSSGGKKFGSHRIAGIGDDFIPEIIKLEQLNDVILVDDGDAINMSRKLARELGLGVGISSGSNFLAAIKAQDILKDEDAVIVTVFADDNKKYLSTDLMEEQEIKDDHIAQYVKLIGFKAIN
jgi:cysteine synthase A